MEKETKHNKLVNTVTKIAQYEIGRMDMFGNEGPHIDTDFVREVVDRADDKLLTFTIKKYISDFLNSHYTEAYYEAEKRKEEKQKGGSK